MPPEPLKDVGYFRIFEGVGEDHSTELGGDSKKVQRWGGRYVRHYGASRKVARSHKPKTKAKSGRRAAALVQEGEFVAVSVARRESDTNIYMHF